MKTVRSLRQFSKEDWKNPFGLALISVHGAWWQGLYSLSSAACSEETTSP